MNAATRRFLLMMPWGRVGSNLVTGLLRSRPSVLIDNEPTTRIRTVGHRDGIPLAEQARQQLESLDRLLRLSARYRWTGAKLSYRSLVEPGRYLGRACEASMRLVLLTRSNHLRCAVSQLRALERAQDDQSLWQSPWAVQPNEPKPGACAIAPAEAVRLTRLFARLESAALEKVQAVYGTDWLRVEYAQLAAAPEDAIGRICDWIEMPRFDIDTLPYRKSTADSLCEDVSNYDEFAVAIRDEGLGAMLSPEMGKRGL